MTRSAAQRHNPGVQTRSFTYDDIGRLKSETHPESGTATYSYDANSNLHIKTEARGISTTFTYDELNRVISKIYSDGTPSVSYFYDSQPAESPISIQNPIGRLTRHDHASGVTTSNYYSTAIVRLWIARPP
jgi:YD repeat-containing protein